MTSVERIQHIKHQLVMTHSEERARIREWLLRAFDDCGVPRKVEEQDEAPRFELASLVRTNLRASTVTWLPSPPPSGPHIKYIYAIASERDWLYVGFTANIRLRRTHHAAALRTGNHHNRLLQRHWVDDPGTIWFAILETIDEPTRNRHGVQHPSEIKWKRRLRPLYDREAKRADISFFIGPTSPRRGGQQRHTQPRGHRLSYRPRYLAHRTIRSS
jgi:GIY-YIG catalytic domain